MVPSMLFKKGPRRSWYVYNNRSDAHNERFTNSTGAYVYDILHIMYITLFSDNFAEEIFKYFWQ